MRPATGLLVDDLIKAYGRETTEQLLPFSDHVDRLMEIILKKESPIKHLAETMVNDAARVKAFFKGIPCQEISLKNVNGYLNQYHPDASANVHNRKLGFIEKLINYASNQSLTLDNPVHSQTKSGRKRSQPCGDSYWTDSKRNHRQKP